MELGEKTIKRVRVFHTVDDWYEMREEDGMKMPRSVTLRVNISDEKRLWRYDDNSGWNQEYYD